jgi:predicted amidophosphoribosyltransferase
VVDEDYDDGLCPKCEIEEEGDDAVYTRCHEEFIAGEDTYSNVLFDRYEAVCEDCREQVEAENQLQKEQTVEKYRVEKANGETSRRREPQPNSQGSSE